MSQRSGDRGPYDLSVGSTTRGGREFWIGVVGCSSRDDSERATVTYSVLREDGFRSSKFAITLDLGPWAQLGGEELAGLAEERLSDVFGELLEPTDISYCDDDDEGDDDDDDDDEAGDG